MHNIGTLPQGMQSARIFGELVHGLLAWSVLHGGIWMMIVHSHLGVVCGIVREEFAEVAHSSRCEVVPT